MTKFHSFEPRLGHGLRHDPFGAMVAPRPIGWISTRGSDGIANLAPYSFFNAFNYKPPIIGFASVGRKDTLANIEASGEFVWNLATRALAEQVNHSSAPADASIDEFVLTGLDALASDMVRPPRVAQSPAALECVCSQVLRLRTASGEPVDTWLVLGEVVKAHIALSVIEDDMFDITLADPLLRGGGLDYFTIDNGHRFTMRRPKA